MPTKNFSEGCLDLNHLTSSRLHCLICSFSQLPLLTVSFCVHPTVIYNYTRTCVYSVYDVINVRDILYVLDITNFLYVLSTKIERFLWIGTASKYGRYS